ncbi:hypothetical protein [Nocardia nova]|uniref:hypothetical protein n=1 Tax=Nocardia nova TaxID=37330 RepID=UPI0011DE2011|nr:hypothetical protein [Nocardia nova]
MVRSVTALEDGYVSRRRVQAGVTLTGFVIAAALSAACLIAAVLSFTANRHESDQTKTAAAASATSVTTAAPTASPIAAEPSGAATTAPAAPEEPLILNKGADEKHPGETVTVGDCVAAVVAAPDGGAPVRKSACNGTDSRYKVTAKVAEGGRCPADADRSVGETLPGGATDTVCLDYNWVAGNCMSVADSPEPIDCAATAPGRVRVVEIKYGTTDVNTCTSGDRGFVYNERRFVVCVAHF